VYYVGINIGGFLAPLVCGTLGEFYGWHWGFGAAGLGMLVGLSIYIIGGKYLPEQTATRAATSAAIAARASYRTTYYLLIGVALAVTVFRAAYEQVGNTVALWADVGIDRATSLLTIPMTWFQSLNPLLVMLMTPPLLAYWKRRASAGGDLSSMRKMALGALIVGGAYLLLAIIAAHAGAGRASWIWLVLFFGIFTFGELYILPIGLGLFARLAPPGFTATTVAGWFLAIFTGSLAAGLVGSLWGLMSHARYFLALAALAAIAAALLLVLDRKTERIEADRAEELTASLRSLQDPGVAATAPHLRPV
jgi:POT family proton-dependent oligopeptide transporter